MVNGDTQEIAFQSISSSTTHWIDTAREFGRPILESQGDCLMLA